MSGRREVEDGEAPETHSNASVQVMPAIVRTSMDKALRHALKRRRICRISRQLTDDRDATHTFAYSNPLGQTYKSAVPPNPPPDVQLHPVSDSRQSNRQTAG